MLYTLHRKHEGEGLHPLKPWYQTDTVTTGLTCVLAVTGLHFGQGPINYISHSFPSDKYLDNIKKQAKTLLKQGIPLKHVAYNML
jgi:hypothetical protein